MEQLAPQEVGARVLDPALRQPQAAPAGQQPTEGGSIRNLTCEPRPIQAGLGLVQLPALAESVEPHRMQQRQRGVKALRSVQPTSASVRASPTRPWA
jgi:hypothetical protein